MNPGVPGQLPVVVDARMQRLMRVLDVMRHDRGEQYGIAGSVGLARETFERAPQIPEFFLLAPRQEAVPAERRHAELLDRGAVLARQLLERIVAELLRPEVNEVIRLLLPAQDAEEIR